MSKIKTENLQDLMSVVNSTEIGLVILDKYFNIRVWNLFLVNHSGLSTESVMGKNLFEQFPYISQPWFSEKALQTITQNQKLFCTWEEKPYLFQFKNVRNRSKNAAYMYQNITFIPLTSANGEIDNFAITINDATDIAASTEQLNAVVSEYSEKLKKDN